MWFEAGGADDIRPRGGCGVLSSRRRGRLAAVLIATVWMICPPSSLVLAQARVRLGADMLIERHLDLLKGKRVGLVTNHTGLLSTGEDLVKVLMSRGIEVTALFGPEHGIRGDTRDGERVPNSQRGGIRVYSLYGETRKPTPGMLGDVDLLLYDIQDVGTRFYTYISTMGLCMEAAADAGIPFVVLDRPDPLGGLKVDGPVMEDSLKSFVGMYPVPVVYGLTCGELAMMINGEGWIRAKADLKVIEMEGWDRSMLWDDTRLPWIAPSPNIVSPATAIVYPATCIVEATNLSEGRGTGRPFTVIGAPFLKAEELAASLRRLNLPGVVFGATSFTPAASKFKGEKCNGLLVEVTDPKPFLPVLTGLTILSEIRRLHPEEYVVKRSSFLRLMGAAGVEEALGRGESPESIPLQWVEGVERFRSVARRYFIYPPSARDGR